MAEILFLRFQKRMGNITVATYTFDTIYEENAAKKPVKDIHLPHTKTILVHSNLEKASKFN